MFCHLEFMVFKHHPIKVTCETVLEESHSVVEPEGSPLQIIVPTSEILHKYQIEHLLDRLSGVTLCLTAGMHPLKVESSFVENDIIQTELSLNHSTGG